MRTIHRLRKVADGTEAGEKEKMSARARCADGKKRCKRIRVQGKAMKGTKEREENARRGRKNSVAAESNERKTR